MDKVVLIHIPIRRIEPLQIFYKEVAPFPFAVSAAHGVALVGQHDEFKFFICLDQGIHYLQGGGGVDIVV